MATRPVVGVPRALLFFEYGHVWQRFLESLGAETLASAPTNRAVVDRGVAAAIDDACLPVKAAYGHCLSLAGRVDAVFVPRVVSVEPKAYSCPKLLGLPDMVRLALPPGTRVLAPLIDVAKHGRAGLARAALETGAALGATPAQVRQAARELELGIRRAVEEQFMFAPGCGRRPSSPAGGEGAREGSPAGSGLRIGLVGHSYNLYDAGLNLSLMDRLGRLGAKLVAPEDYAPALLEAAARRDLRKPLFWTLGKRIVGAARLMASEPDLAGIIAVQSFGCGPDSMVIDLSMRLVNWERPRLPFMELTLDEHTGEAGLVTRLEAFTDLASRRQRAG
jgi:predicted nucleotide-binding protein (sugar kinase/HSP70/actin superfamily)